MPRPFSSLPAPFSSARSAPPRRAGRQGACGAALPAGGTAPRGSAAPGGPKMYRYERLGEDLGEGTYGQVYKARCKRTRDIVAVKAIKFFGQEPGANFTALREIKILRELRHPNIAQLRDVFLGGGEARLLNLVFEYCITNLESLLHDKTKFFAPADSKGYFVQLLRGLEHCHANFVLHRDLKPANLLVSAGGVLKITDFGLARFHGSPELMTDKVMTVWYRPPELLLGARRYSHAVDMWSAGCIFGEILRRSAIFQGKSLIDQLKCIFQALGTPTEEDWPGWEHLPDRAKFSIAPYAVQNIRCFFPGVDNDAWDLLMKLLSLNPEKRPDSHAALAHDYFTNEPQPTPPADLPRPAVGQGAPAGGDRPNNGEGAAANGAEPDAKRARRA